MLRPRWLALHVVVLAGAGAMLRLSRWQWDRAHRTHSLQNWSYAVEWVLFAVFTIVAYVRIARDEVGGDDAPPAARTPRAGAPAVSVAAVTDEEDPELAAYNRYLAELTARSEG
ncbi:MAG: hypothetical protein M3N21_01040 [Actinomycetota bacterium]|nr:hypothetical protein [Actinomycetota bacterium]